MSGDIHIQEMSPGYHRSESRRTGASQAPVFAPTNHSEEDAAMTADKSRQSVTTKQLATQGWRSWLVALCRLFGASGMGPGPGPKERQQLLRERSVDELRSLTDQVPKLKIAFFNTKGHASTTTTAVHVAATAADFTRTVVTMVDGNPAEGTCAARLGRNDGETVTTQQLARTISDDEDLRQRDFVTEISRARPSKQGVRLISADSIVTETSRLSGKAMGRVLELIGYNSEYTMIDSPNDIGETVARAIAGSADVFVFTANAQAPDTLRRLSTSMETLRNLGYADKVDNSVVSISNLPPGADLESYRKFLNMVSFNDEPTRRLEQKFDGQFLGVPHDAAVARDTIVDLDALNWETQQAYLDHFAAALQQSPKYRDSSRVSPDVASSSTDGSSPPSLRKE